MRETVYAALSQVATAFWLVCPMATPPAQYITFSILQSDDAYGDNSPTEEQYVVYVDFFSTTDDQAKADQIKTLMRAAGFALVDDMPMYEDETKRYHISTTWNWVDE